MTEAARDIRFGVQLPTDTPAGTAGIGERLRAARRAQGLSQRTLSAAAGVTYAYICRIERGTRTPSLEVIRHLATALEVSPRWIETGDDDRWNAFSQAELAALRAALVKSGGPASLGLLAELTDALEPRAEDELGAV
ncbi:MAG: helix-turn-helix domain-containing protein [Gaiellaceae bacterium]